MPRLLLALVLLTLPAAAEEPPYHHLHLSRVEALRDRVAGEVVRLEVTRPAVGLPDQTLRFDGAAVHVGEGRLLTSAFLVKDAAAIAATLPGGTIAPARVVRESAQLGLALLEVPEARGLPVPALAPDGELARGP